VFGRKMQFLFTLLICLKPQCNQNASCFAVHNSSASCGAFTNTADNDRRYQIGFWSL